MPSQRTGSENASRGVLRRGDNHTDALTKSDRLQAPAAATGDPMRLRMRATPTRSQSFWSRLGLALVRRRLKTYQPILTDDDGGANRPTFARWQAIEPHLVALRPSTLCDLGCAEGFFLLKAAKASNAICIGVDADPRRLWFAYNQMMVDSNAQRCGFLCAQIDLSLLARIGAQDVWICLSLFHHILYEHGLRYASELMKTLQEKTQQAMFFEMGQSDEIRMKWANRLPDMGRDPHLWVQKWLLSCGWTTIEKISEHASYKKETTRGLWLCRKYDASTQSPGRTSNDLDI